MENIARTGEHFMRLAIEQAREALRAGALPVGAIVVMDGAVIGKGHRVRGNFTRLDHAEMLALRDAFKDRDYHAAPSMAIYATLEPCMMCFGTLLGVKIGSITYAMEDPHAGATHIPREEMPFRHQKEFPMITKGILREESLGLFRQYFATTDNPAWQNKEHLLVKLCLET